MPSSREQYIHRLGRTGRAGKEGIGWLILGPFETLFLNELKNIDVPKDADLTQLLSDDGEGEEDMDELLGEMKDRVGGGARGSDETLTVSGQKAYQAFLGYYSGQLKRINVRDKVALVEIANAFSSAMGFKNVPALKKSTVGKMGLKGVRGIVLEGSEGGGRGSSTGSKGAGHADGRRAPPKREYRGRR